MLLSNFKLGQRQIDQKLRPWKGLWEEAVPVGGWLRTIRAGLGLPAVSLAKRLGIKPASVANLEQSEAAGTVSLNTLRKAAAAMDCVVVYAVVPKSSLKEILERQAREKAKPLLARVSHTMALEMQGVDAEEMKHQAQEIVASLLENPRALWK